MWNSKFNNAMPIPKRALPRRWKFLLFFLSLILYQFDDNMAFIVVGVLHAQLDRSLCGGKALQSKTIDSSPKTGRRTGDGRIASSAIIQHFNIFTSNDLFHASVHRVSDFDKVVITEDEVLSVKTSRLGAADKLHHNPARDVAVLIHVHGAFFEGNK